VANGFTNEGLIELTSLNVGYPATLNVTSGQLINAPGATLAARVGAGSQRTLGAAVDNQGTLLVEANLNWNKNGGQHLNSGTITLSGANINLTQNGGASFTTTGTIDLGSGNTFDVNSGTWDYAGGSITGSGTLDFSNVTLNLTPDLSNADHLLLLTSTTVNGPGQLINEAGQTLILSGGTVNADLVNRGLLPVHANPTINGQLSVESGATLQVDGLNGAATLTVANGFTNEGLIELTSLNVGYPATLNVTSGQLINAPGATLAARVGAGSQRTLGAAVDNQGTLLVEANLNWNKNGGQHLNSGTITLSGANINLTQNGTTPSFSNIGVIQIGDSTTFDINGGTFTNETTGRIEGAGTLDVSSSTLVFNGDGTIAPGTSAGLLGVTGNLPRSASAVVEVELGGLTPDTEHDQLVVSGSVTLDGTLHVTLIDSFTPVKGDAFEVMTFSSLSGTFATVEPPLPHLFEWAIDYSDTAVMLTVTNTAPQFTATDDQTINEETVLSLAVSATDNDVPGQNLTYSLLESPAGMGIDDGTGQLTWNPAEDQGPGTYTIRVRAVDDGVGTLDTTNTFLVEVKEVNRVPSLVLPAAPVGNELTDIILSITASDPDFPANPLTITLDSAPPNAVFDTSTGMLTWRPSEADGPGSTPFTFTVRDSSPDAVNETELSATDSFDLAVHEVNVPPTLALPADPTINEGVAYNDTASSTDADLPVNSIQYTLISGPAGLTIDPNTGAISWTPGEDQGPGTHNAVVLITDSNPDAVNEMALSDTDQFTITVNEVNEPPALDAVANRTIHAEGTFSLILSAMDPDQPANALSYSLVSGPAGADVQPDTGLFTWHPTLAELGSTNTVTVQVDDNGFPVMTDSLSFELIVGDTLLILKSGFDGQDNPLITWRAIPTTIYRLQYTTDLVTPQWTEIGGEVTANDVTASSTDPDGGQGVTRFYRVIAP